MADDTKKSPDVNALLRAKFNELCAKRDAINASLEPDREQCRKVHKDIQALYDTIAPLGAKIKGRMPELQQIENDIAKLAIALGGKRMSDAPAAAA